VVAVTGRGSIRTHNEDAALVFEWISQAARPQVVELASALTPPLVCAIADGLGGHAAGAAASWLTLTRLAEVYPDWTDTDAVADGLVAISDAVYRAGTQDPGRLGMRATIAGLVICPGEVLCFNVGDSRAYQVTDGYLEQITVDDATVGPDGRPTGVVTQTIGDLPEPQLRPHIVKVPLRPGSVTRMLLCSDGVTGPVEEPLLRRLCREPELGRLVVGLRDAAYDAGAPDNLSIVALDIDPTFHDHMSEVGSDRPTRLDEANVDRGREAAQ
jgi:protein phosphatase